MNDKTKSAASALPTYGPRRPRSPAFHSWPQPASRPAHNHADRAQNTIKKEQKKTKWFSLVQFGIGGKIVTLWLTTSCALKGPITVTKKRTMRNVAGAAFKTFDTPRAADTIVGADNRQSEIDNRKSI
jgi:hypothetical protein